jgi:hypothetical protein
MFSKIKEFFIGKPAEVVAPAVESAPYKVPEPAATTPIPLVVEAAPVAEVKPVAVKKAPKVVKPKAPKAPAMKVTKAPAVKKPRAPRATKSAN